MDEAYSSKDPGFKSNVLIIENWENTKKVEMK